MNLYSRPLLLCLWIAIMIAWGSVLAILIGRKAYREYPAFTAFIMLGTVRDLILFYIASYHAPYHLICYWGSWPLDLVCTVALVREVFFVIFHPFSTLPRRAIPNFLQATVAVSAVVLLFTLRFPGAQPTLWMTFARAMDQVVSWTLCGIFGFIVLFAKYFGIPWRHRVYGIATGFLFYLSVDTAVTTAVAQLRLPPYTNVKMVDMLAVFLECLIWIYFFTRPEESRLLPNLEQIKEIQALVGNHAIAITGTRCDEPTRSDKPWGGQ